MDARAIQEVIPHRPPFLFIDEITSLEPGVRAVGVKKIDAGEPFFAGHFPGHPVLPGVLIIEALAQVGAVAVLSACRGGRLPLLAGVDGARFLRPVPPGVTLRLEVELVRRRANAGRGHGRAFVGEAMVAEADFLFALVPPTPPGPTPAGSDG